MYSESTENMLKKSTVYLLCLNMISKAISGIGSINSFKDSTMLNNIIFDELVTAAKAKQKM